MHDDHVTVLNTPGASILGRGWRAPINRVPPIIKLQNVHPCQSVIKIMTCLYCLNCSKFGQLIIRKIIRMVATRCQIFGVKMYKIRFRLGLRLRPIWGAHSTPPDSLAAFRGRTFKGRGGKGRQNEGEKEGRKRSLGHPNLHHRSRSTPLKYVGNLLLLIILFSQGM